MSCAVHTVSAAPLSLLLFFTDGADIMDRNGQKIGTLFGSHYVLPREEMLSVDIHRVLVVWKYCVCVRACVCAWESWCSSMRVKCVVWCVCIPMRIGALHSRSQAVWFTHSSHI